MKRFLLALFMGCSLLATARMTPAENSRLNYRLVGFSIPCKKKCVLEVASGSFNNVDSFKKNIVISRVADDGKTIVEVPEFDAAYSWRILGGNSETQIHHFSTRPCPNADTSKAHFRIISSDGQTNDHYVFADVTGALYDMRGKLVWFIPPELWRPFKKSGIRDIRMTPFGTLTFLNEDEATEIDYNGNILFSTRGSGKISGDTTEFLHHEFTRLANGHYMVLGSEYKMLELPRFRPDSVQLKDRSFVINHDGKVLQKLEFGTVIEYDETGKLVWSWRSSNYFVNSDLFTHFRPDGRFLFEDVHENSFCFDEGRKAIYIGFRDISRIIKIKYPEGTVLAEYGANFENSDQVLCNNFFCGQHRIAINSDGDLCLYNNNAIANGADPKIVVLKEAKDKTGGLQKIWEFNCTTEGMSAGELQTYERLKEQTNMLNRVNPASAKATRLTSGGNVVPLRGDSYFASMSGLFAKCFIVDKNKQIVWSAVPEMKLYPEGPWTAIATYRESIISDKELESLVWHSR
jgi:hypothetical protein